MTEIRPFEAIPAEAARVLRPVLPDLAEGIIAAIAREVPDYRRAMKGAFGSAVRMGVERALGRFVDLIEDPRGDDRSGRDVYVELGRGELRVGRSLDALLAAYRVGARIAWRRFVDAGVEGGLPPSTLYRLGEAIFAYIDEISAESAEGYAEEQSAAAGERQRRRRALVQMLTQHPPAGDEAIRTAALAAGWPLPRELAAVVVAAADDPGVADARADRLARRLGPDAVGAAVDERACALLPDPDGPGRRRQLEAALEGAPAVLGPTVPWPQAADSVRRALAAQRLAATGRLATAGVIVADEHLAALVVGADPELGTALATTRLAPLEDLAPAVRERLLQTLRAWVDRPGQVQAMAAALDVHPQTVRYRLRQLREVFGSRLDDPEQRFELALALRIQP